MIPPNPENSLKDQQQTSSAKSTSNTPQNNLSNEARSKGGQNSPGNFKNDRERAVRAGQKGGQMSGGNFKNNPERASLEGRKGGSVSHSGRQTQTQQ